MTSATTISFKSLVLDMSMSMPVLVDFWAPWCGPCKAMNPLLEQFGGEMGGRLSIVKVNVDEEPPLAARLGVQSIPDFRLFLGGVQVAKRVGGMTLEGLRQFVNVR